MDFMQLAGEKRYSVRRFKDQPVEREKLRQIEGGLLVPVKEDGE